MSMAPENNQRKSLKDFFKLGEVGGYFFRAKDASRPSNINIKMMHGVNKISMIMFLICVLIIIFRVIARKFF